jgi:DNA invertase Pin-like site-specific DNA recombinase
MKYGYARASTEDQNAAMQLKALKRAGCRTVFKDDGLSGATTKLRAVLRCNVISPAQFSRDSAVIYC